MKNSEAILVTPKQFEIQECPVPEPKDHEILMKVEYVGMCGSDIHGFEFGPFIPPKDPNQKIGLGVTKIASEFFIIISCTFFIIIYLSICTRCAFCVYSNLFACD